ncbi:hypothetical protein HACA111877_14115 [Halomonas casei]
MAVRGVLQETGKAITVVVLRKRPYASGGHIVQNAVT